MNIKVLLTFLFFSTMYSTTAIGQPSDDDNWIIKWLWLLENHYEDSKNEDDLKLKINLKKEWKFSIGDNKQWTSPDYNDSRWENIKVPADWENEGFNGYDGHACYRVHFDGSLLEEDQTHFLNLGSIDDVDEAYINGTLVGRSGCFPPEFKTAYKANRKYYIPNESINFNGDNVIAVRVYDDVLNGGISHGNLGIYVTKENETLNQNLYGFWKFSTENDPDFKNPDFNDNQWRDHFIPSYWDNQGYSFYDGIAWYRKTFDLVFPLEHDKTYYMVLGKIDDFDITYLNGEKIGSTNDGMGFGQSRSYEKLRIYKIPSGLLNIKSSNVLAIKVSDIGLDGGVYTGPIGIIEESNLTRLIRD